MAKHHKKIPNNDHHLLWTRKTWANGYAQLLRRAFVVNIDWNLHERLHVEVEPIPVPDESILAEAWERLQTDRERVQTMSVIQKIEWLIDNVDDGKFRKAMAEQLRFFRNN